MIKNISEIKLDVEECLINLNDEYYSYIKINSGMDEYIEVNNRKKKSTFCISIRQSSSIKTITDYLVRTLKEIDFYKYSDEIHTMIRFIMSIYNFSSYGILALGYSKDGSYLQRNLLMKDGKYHTRKSKTEMSKNPYKGIQFDSMKIWFYE